MEWGRRFKSQETMAVQSVTHSAPLPRPKPLSTFIEDPKIPFAVALLLADAVLVFLIIAYVPYTKIDWDAYMSQVTGFLGGERDYSNLKGDTGPLVYPAGFLYIYSAFQYVTGGEVYPAQVLFGILYIVNLVIILFIYVKTNVLPWWALCLLSLSKRVHSIFMLRLFNDCVAMALLHVAILLLMHQRWHLGLITFSEDECASLCTTLIAPHAKDGASRHEGGLLNFLQSRYVSMRLRFALFFSSSSEKFGKSRSSSIKVLTKERTSIAYLICCGEHTTQHCCV